MIFWIIATLAISQNPYKKPWWVESRLSPAIERLPCDSYFGWSLVLTTILVAEIEQDFAQDPRPRVSEISSAAF
jgi:hypothetical protein